MYDFILQMITFVSLGLIIFLLVRGTARIPDNDLENITKKPNYLDQLLNKIPFKKIDELIGSFLGKMLRRIRVLVMKVDNLLNQYINKFKKNGENNGGLPPRKI